MKLDIHVLPRHIKIATPKDPYDCPIAHVLREAFREEAHNQVQFGVGNGYIWIFYEHGDAGRKECFKDLPRSARDFIDLFDEFSHSCPYEHISPSFYLELPDELAKFFKDEYILHDNGG